jgi:PAS domain S-box-containing protein
LSAVIHHETGNPAPTRRSRRLESGGLMRTSEGIRALCAEEYRILVEQAPIMIWRSDTTTGCDWFNERWLAFRGRRFDEEVGEGWAEGVHAEDLERCLRVYLEAFARREPFVMEYRLLRFDGAYRWIHDTGSPYSDGADNFAGFIGSCVDITDEVAAREILERQKEREIRELRALLPICARCKSVRDDKGYWRRVEVYLERLSGTPISHGICPECSHILYPEELLDPSI